MMISFANNRIKEHLINYSLNQEAIFVVLT